MEKAYSTPANENVMKQERKELSEKGQVLFQPVLPRWLAPAGEEGEVKKILDCLRDVFAPNGPPVFLIAIIAFLVAMLASIYLESILS
jgi:hypothetical protein